MIPTGGKVRALTAAIAWRRALTGRLVFTNVIEDRDSAAGVAAGWHAGLEVVEAQLDGRAIDWSAWDRADQLGEEYARSFG